MHSKTWYFFPTVVAGLITDATTLSKSYLKYVRALWQDYYFETFSLLECVHIKTKYDFMLPLILVLLHG